MTFDKGSIQSPGRSIRGAHPRWHGSMVGVRGMLQTARSGRRRVFSPHPVDARKRSNVFLTQTSTRVHGLLVPTRSTRHGSRTHCHWTVQILSFLLAMKLCTTSTSCLVAGATFAILHARLLHPGRWVSTILDQQNRSRIQA